MRRFSFLFSMFPERRRPLGDGARARIDLLLRRGREREAVLVYRDETGAPLEDARRAVRQFRVRRDREATPGP